MTRGCERGGVGLRGERNGGGGGGEDAGEETGLHEHTILLRQPTGQYWEAAKCQAVRDEAYQFEDQKCE